MAQTGLEVFDKTVQTTNTWLDEIVDELGPSKQNAWHVLGAVLRTLRDRLPLDLAVHLGAQLPLLVRGLYYDQWHPASQPEKERTAEEFLARVELGLQGIRPMNIEQATKCVLGVLSRHIDPGQTAKVIDALPQGIRPLWPAPGAGRSGMQAA